MALTAEDMNGIKGLLDDVITRRVDPRFEKVDAQFDRVNERFERVDAQFNKIDSRFRKVERQFKSIDEQFVEVKLEIRKTVGIAVTDVCSVIEAGLTMVGDRFDQVDHRLDVLERGGNKDEPWR